MKHYNVTGMSCAACSARVEKAVMGVGGVKSCAVSLLTNSMRVEGDVPDDDIISAVRAAGYDASAVGDGTYTGNGSATKGGNTGISSLDNNESGILLRRLVVSVILLIPLMILSMGKMIGINLPSVFESKPAVTALSEMIFAAAIMITGQKFFRSGVKGLLKGAPNMDTLVSLGSAAAFIYSTVTLYRMVLSPADASSLTDGLYYESSGTILTLITVGKFLEAKAKGKTTSALRSLMELRPDKATVIRDGKEQTVPIDQVRIGEIFKVRPGESIPFDSVIIDGFCAVNESVLTGESLPVDKAVGDSVFSGTLDVSGVLTCRVTGTGEDTALSKIIRAVSDAASTKAPIARIADKVSGIFVPAVIAVAVITFFAWMIAGKDIGFALARGISVLVISCPCALGLATPVAIMVGSGVGAKNLILFKTAASIEGAGRISVIALDKTGTVTSGDPAVTDIIPFDTDEKTLLIYAAALEKSSEHPLAKAIVKKAEEMYSEIPQVTGFTALTGSGVEAKLGDTVLVCGNADMVFGKENRDVRYDTILKKADELSGQGKTPVFFSFDGEPKGIIAVADTLRDDSRNAVSELHKMGIKTVLVTGDNERTAKAIASQVGIDEVYASVKPEGKAEIIRRLSSTDCKGKTAMVGDGINDAPALTSADIGMAIGTGTDVAVESADIVLPGTRLTDVCSAVKIGRAVLRNIRQNLFWAFIYNVLGIPLAAGVFIPIFNIELSPMIAALAMSLSSFCVVTNALRLNFIRLPERKTFEKEIIQMENVTLKVEGMMCTHCEAHVKKALEAIPQVKEATASHEKGTVEIVLSENLSTDVLKKAIEGEGYKVI